MKKQICLDCFQIFEAPQKKEVADHTGQPSLIIDVCPACISNHIEPAENLHFLVMDETEVTHLKLMANVFKEKATANLLKCNEPVLADHYRSLLMITDNILNGIKQHGK